MAFGFAGIYDEDEAQRIVEADFEVVDSRKTKTKPEVRIPKAREQAPGQETRGQAGETAVQEAKDAAQAATGNSEPVKLGMAEFVAAEKALLGKLKKHGISPVEAEGKAIKAGFGQDIKETERVPYLQFLASLMGEEYNAA